MSAVTLSLLLMGVIFIISDRFVARQSLSEEVSTLAKVIASQSTAALSFYDKNTAEETLSALRLDSTIELSCIYDKSGKLFASFSEVKSILCPDSQLNDGIVYSADALELIYPIILQNDEIGKLYLRASMAESTQRINYVIKLTISMVFFIALIAYFLASKLQAIISKPIVELAKFTQTVSSTSDYQLRIAKGSNDEIGTLRQAFNSLLETIHARVLARNIAEQALKENERNLTITLNSIADAVIATDAEGNITRMNPVAEVLTGWPLAEALGKPVETVFPIIDTNTKEKIINPVEKVLKTGQVVHLSDHTTLISRNGQKIQIADSAAPIQDDDKVLGMVLVFIDVTEQYRLREEAAKHKRDLQNILDNSPSIIYVKDLQGRFIFTNKQFNKNFQPSFDNCVGKTLIDIFPEKHAAQLEHNDQSVLATGQVLEVEEIAPQDDGEHAYWSVKFPLLNESGSAYAVCAMATDISEKKQQQQLLQRQEEQLRRSQKMDALGKLSGGIAHDYNNMLGIILGYAEMIDQTASINPKLKTYIAQIIKAGERSAKLTQKLLGMSRNKASANALVNGNDLIRGLENVIEKTLTARIQLVLDLVDSPWNVWLDGADLEDAIVNLCINAMHAMQGQGRLSIKTWNTTRNTNESEQREYFALSISDTGCGMDEEMKAQVFDPFFSTKGEMGTGLGLSQVYGFIQRSNGAISVDSIVGEGSTFTLYFPKSTKQQSIEDEVHYDELAPVTKGYKVLVVDDEPAMLKLSCEILAQNNYTVASAKNGEEALALMAAEHFDIVLTDIVMPVMNGYQLAATISEQYPTVKIQLVSGYSDREKPQNQHLFANSDILYKPFKTKTLLTRVFTLLQQDSSTDINTNHSSA